MMKKQILLGVLCVLTMGLAAFGGLSTVGAAPAGGEPDTSRYVQDGKALSSEAVKALKAQHGDLFFLMDSDASGPVARVFTHPANLERALGDEKAKKVCVATRLRTSVYELVGFGGDVLSLTPGTSIANLITVAQPGGGFWNNVISSIRAADCVSTYLYDLPNFNGSFVVLRGINATLPGLFNNSISSIRVVL